MNRCSSLRFAIVGVGATDLVLVAVIVGIVGVRPGADRGGARAGVRHQERLVCHRVCAVCRLGLEKAQSGPRGGRGASWTGSNVSPTSSQSRGYLLIFPSRMTGSGGISPRRVRTKFRCEAPAGTRNWFHNHTGSGLDRPSEWRLNPDTGSSPGFGADWPDSQKSGILESHQTSAYCG